MDLQPAIKRRQMAPSNSFFIVFPFFVFDAKLRRIQKK
jgi:hypothetical protein